MRDGRPDGGDRAGHPSYHGPMVMAADDPLDLSVHGDHGREIRGITKIDPVHVLDPASERRVVHGYDGRLFRLLLQCPLQKREAARTEFTMGSAGHQRVQHHQPDRIVVHRILDELGIARDPRQGREDLPQGAAPIMIARNDEDRDRKVPPEQLQEQRVLARQAAIREVARDDDRVRPWVERSDRPESPFRQHVRLDDPIGRESFGPHVQIGELTNQHRCSWRRMRAPTMIRYASKHKRVE